MSLEWDTLAVEPWLLDAVAGMGLRKMTPVQASTIPLFSTTKDVVVELVTGSGKTLAFALPVLHHVLQRLREPVKRGHMLLVVVSPTRELASQTKAVFDKVGQFAPHPIRTQLVVGLLGSVRHDIELFLEQQTHVLIGTPGRLLEMLGLEKVHTGAVAVAVLDEADKLLDMLFEAEVVAVLERLPKQRRTGLFSATLLAAGDRIFRAGLQNPVRVLVSTKKKSAPKLLVNQYMLVQPEKKLTTLMKLVDDYHYRKCMVYLPTCQTVKHLASLMALHTQVPLHILHGQLPTAARLRSVERFTQAEGKHVLLTTDVAARGIDIDDVDLVVQMDPPTDPAMFLHRCGRTARANRMGRAILMLHAGSRQEEYVEFLAIKGIALKQIPTLEPAFHAAFQKQVEEYMLADRARHELAVRAYVALVRTYTKHIASSIFRVAELDLVGLARMYGLLRVPKMPELKHVAEMPEKGWLTDKISDMEQLKYADEKKERERVANQESVRLEKIEAAKKRRLLKTKNDSWLKQKDEKEAKLARREKLRKKREAAEQRLLEQLLDLEPEDWKDAVRRNKKQKIAAFDL